MLIPENLKKTLLDAECCGILFSGGFDSEVLLRSAASVLGGGNRQHWKVRSLLEVPVPDRKENRWEKQRRSSQL